MLKIVCLLSCLGTVLCGGIGLTQPLLQYPAEARTSVAYGNNAFLARFAGFSAAAPLTGHTTYTATHAALATPVIAARTAYAAPLVSSVHHVPAFAQVPVTKFEAQPAVLQNVVDIANPKVATRKFEIRRPAIQKEFYDIEERVVVRPAGSAVVELDQPISKSQRGPTVVSPAVPAVAPVQSLVRTLPAATHSLHAQAVYPALSALHIQSYPVQAPTLQQPLQPAAPAPVPQQPVGPSTPRPDFSFDDSDSVSIENPEFRSSVSTQQQQQQRQNPDELLRQRLIEQSITQAEARAQLELQARAQYQARAQQEQRTQEDARNQLEQQVRAEVESRAQQEFQTRARIQAQQRLIDQQQLNDQQQLLRAGVRSQLTAERAPAPVREEIEVRSRSGDIRDFALSRSSYQAHEIPSVRNLPEVELSNQARLIALLTERGPVSEVRTAGEALDSRVRARVLSATPAPPHARARDEQVNTRRVVVNRPIQTVQEVDVVEPFTKIERVAVHQPAVIKTARLGVANVATSLPVHTYTHAHYAI